MKAAGWNSGETCPISSSAAHIPASMSQVELSGVAGKASN